MQMKFSLRQVALFIFFIIVMFVVVLFVRAMMTSSQGPSVSARESYSTMAAPPQRDDAVMPQVYGMGNIPETDAQKQLPASMPVRNIDAPTGVSKIIKNAELTLRVESIDTTAQRIDKIRIEQGGQIGNSTFGLYASSKTGDITIWVPSDRFDTTLMAIKKNALQVSNERIAVADVSAQFVDLEARLKNMRATEVQYLEIMKRSGTIPDILNVTRELSQTRQSIEQLQGQLNYLSRQIALSSIHIVLTEEIAPILSKDEWRPLSVVKAATRETLRDLTSFVDMLLVFLVRLPLLLLQLGFWISIIYGLWRFGISISKRLSRVRLPGSQEKL